MTDYSETVKALRCCISKNPPETCVGCTYSKCNNECAVRRMILDAAAAIEELQFELDCVNDSVKMLSLPIDGKWIRVENDDSYHYECSRCGERPLYSRYGDIVLSGTCPMCGAKMEVQE